MAKTTFTNLAIKGADSGSVALVAGTATVANTTVTANSVPLLTVTLRDAVNQGMLSVVVTAGTGFVITSSNALDTSTVSYIIVDNT